MQTHPDADAFVLQHLRSPANATTRLVFADWLEDTGTPSNVAWAHYIRLREEANRLSPDAGRRPLLRRGAEHAAKVRAKLTLAARVFVRNPGAALQLIPVANITVQLANFDTPRAVLELVPESIARENELLPLALHGNTLFCATTEPQNSGTAEKLSFILNRDIVLVGSERADVQEAINHHYGQTETESVDSVLVEFADTASPFIYHGSEADLGYNFDAAGAPVVRLVNLILTEAISQRADRILIEPEPDAVAIRYRVEGNWIERDRAPRRLLRAIAVRVALLASADISEVLAPPRTAYPLTGRFDFPLQSARFRIDVTIHSHPNAPTIELALTEFPA